MVLFILGQVLVENVTGAGVSIGAGVDTHMRDVNQIAERNYEGCAEQGHQQQEGTVGPPIAKQALLPVETTKTENRIMLPVADPVGVPLLSVDSCLKKRVRFADRTISKGKSKILQKKRK